MPTPEESTLHKGGESVDLQSSGPYREEIEPQINAQVKGTDGATKPLRKGTNGEKATPDTSGTNPKRTENSRPD